MATPSPSATPTPAPLAAPLLVTVQWTDYADNYVCQSDPSSQTVDVLVQSGTKSMRPASADQFGAFRVSDDGRCLAHSAFIGDSQGGSYDTTVVDLNSAATVATMTGYAPAYWLDDDRLVVTQFYEVGPAYLLSAAFSNPLKIASDRPVGALP